tara:strand:- start:477 stop:620 length:144 start_codon:yes stop_codon:yes gene_type:complete
VRSHYIAATLYIKLIKIKKIKTKAKKLMFFFFEIGIFLILKKYINII